MRITVFTGNQPRHTALVNTLAAVADDVLAVRECTTLFPGVHKDRFGDSEVMRRYFARMIQAEADVFGGASFTSPNVQTLAMKAGDLGMVSLETLAPALDSDYYVVFGASFIRSPLIELLLERRAVNIHMGVSPYYRGASCNFWAMLDGNYALNGATIHLLDKGLDSGNILFHALPPARECEPFELGMVAVKAAHSALVARIRDGSLFAEPPVPQDRSKEIRYTRLADFTDDIAAGYLESLPTPQMIGQALKQRDMNLFVRAAVLPAE